jgi:manganese efflux pump family protein
MKWVALVTWVLTAGGGFVLLGLWLKNGGMRQAGQAGDRIRPPRILSHFALAATGLVVWIIYVAADTEALAWVALVLLAIVALLGFSMLFIWLRQGSHRPATAAGTTGDSVPAERYFPNVIVAVHGVLAATTLVLVVLVAAGVGD